MSNIKRLLGKQSPAEIAHNRLLTQVDADRVERLSPDVLRKMKDEIVNIGRKYARGGAISVKSGRNTQIEVHEIEIDLTPRR